MAPLLLTVPEAAQLLAVSRQTIYRLIHDGKLDAVAVHSVTRVPRDSLDRYVVNAERVR